MFFLPMSISKFLFRKNDFFQSSYFNESNNGQRDDKNMLLYEKMTFFERTRKAFRTQNYAIKLQFKTIYYIFIRLVNVFFSKFFSLYTK